MAELTVETGTLRGTTVTFSENDSFVIGSGTTCSLRLEGPGVADQHVVIKALKNGGFGIKRLDGKFTLNGRGADAARLSEGDVLEVADTRLRFGQKKAGGAADLGVLGGYRLIEVIGKGGHGTVYRAEQLSLHRNVALKVLPKETTQNPEFVGRFVAEARAAARLSHPNVVQVFDVGHDGDTYFLSMEIMEHGSLEDRLKREGKIPVEECLQLMIDAAEGLSYAESMRIVHRDIKPDNLMVDSHDTAKIADLGLALSDDEEHGRIVGTPHFMSPEQARGKPLDHRSDLYSLGCTFFRLVTGRTLFLRPATKEILRAHVNDEPESADHVDPDVPRNVAAIIDRLVEKDPDDRYQTSEALLADLNRALHPPARRGPLVVGLVVALLAVGGAIYYVATKEPKVVTVNTGDPSKLAETQKRLRESNAETEHLRIHRKQLPTLQLAEQLEAFARAEKYTGTAAAVKALEEAAELRKKEEARLAAEKQRNDAIDAAHATLKQRVTALIDAGKYREAVAGLQPTDIAADLLGSGKIQALITELRGSIANKAGATLKGMTDGIKAAHEKRDAKAMGTAIDALGAVLDRKTGWPDAAFADRAGTTKLHVQAKVDLARLREELEAEREKGAREKLEGQFLGDDGVLSAVAAFDLEGAAKKASKLQKDVEGFENIHRTAGQIALVVQAAAAYLKEFDAAIAAGKLRVPVDAAGTLTEVPVSAFEPKKGLAVQVDGAERIEPLATLRGNRLRDVFQVTQPDNPTHAAGRLALLALHAIHEHLDAARAYLGTVDPAQNGDAPRYEKSLLDINYVAQQLNDVNAEWGDFLKREVRAVQTLARGLQAFSNRRFATASNHLQSLRTRYANALSLRRID